MMSLISLLCKRTRRLNSLLCKRTRRIRSQNFIVQTVSASFHRSVYALFGRRTSFVTDGIIPFKTTTHTKREVTRFHESRYIYIYIYIALVIRSYTHGNAHCPILIHKRRALWDAQTKKRDRPGAMRFSLSLGVETRPSERLNWSGKVLIRGGNNAFLFRIKWNTSTLTRFRDESPQGSACIATSYRTFLAKLQHVFTSQLLEITRNKAAVQLIERSRILYYFVQDISFMHYAVNYIRLKIIVVLAIFTESKDTINLN